MTVQATGQYTVTGAVPASLYASAPGRAGRIRPSSTTRAHAGKVFRGAYAGDALTGAQADEGTFDGLG
jgi:hypothetical protein